MTVSRRDLITGAAALTAYSALPAYGAVHIPGWRAADALYVCRKLGLTSGLQLVLDAGDASSYTSGQSWLDRSGNGYDFFLGDDGSATATDPTFNGTAGQLSSGEYFSFDGGDYFTYDTTNEAWMQFHKDNAQWSYMGWWYMGVADVVNALFGTRGAVAGGNIGIRVGFNTANKIVFQQRDGTTNQTVYTTTVTHPGINTWFMVALQVNEAGGAAASFAGINTTIETFDGTYTATTASNASFTLRIGDNGEGSGALDAGGRHAISVFRDTLTQGEALAFYQATRGRFGV